MSERISTPDILGSLMGSNIAIEQESNKTIKQENHKAIIPELQLAIEEEKEKATFNLPVGVLVELEKTWSELRKLFKSKQVSKTLLVEIALEMAFEDHKALKQESKLYGKIANHKAIKQ